MSTKKVKLSVECQIKIEGILTEEQIDQIEIKVNEKLTNDEHRHFDIASKDDKHNYEMDFFGEDIEIEIDSDIPIVDGGFVLSEESLKLIKLREVQKLIESGNAVLSEDGKIVDVKDNPGRPKVGSF